MSSLEPLSHANLYCSNLPETLTEADAVKELFLPYGDVRSVRVVNFQRSSGNKIFAFVCMHDAQQAAAALAGLNQSVVQGHKLTVKLADGDISERAANKVVPPNSTLYVKYPADVSLEQLRGVFLPYGKVIDIRELGNRASTSSTVICSAALVELESTASATAAIADLHNRELPGSGTNLVVRYAYPQRNASSKPAQQRQQQHAGGSTAMGRSGGGKQSAGQQQRYQAAGAWQQRGPPLPQAAWQAGPSGPMPYVGVSLPPHPAGPYGVALGANMHLHRGPRQQQQQQQQQYLYEPYHQGMQPPPLMHLGPSGPGPTGPLPPGPYPPAAAEAPGLRNPLGQLHFPASMAGPGAAAAAQPQTGAWPLGPGRHPAAASGGPSSGLPMQLRPPHLLSEPPGLQPHPAGIGVMGYPLHMGASMAPGPVEVSRAGGHL
jgi:RNA recognition motif-containing protein